MEKERLKSIISGLHRYELTGLERRFVQSFERCFKENGRLTDRQESIIEGIYGEKTRWIRNAIFSLL